jgi:hypothetical protein
MALRSAKSGPSGLKKKRIYSYNHLCDVDEESISDTLNEELDIDSDDEMDLEIEGETVSEESSNKMSESERETSVVAC